VWQSTSKRREPLHI